LRQRQRYRHLLFASDFSNAAQLKRNGGGGYAKTVTVFAPKLGEVGVNEDTLHRVLVENPRCFLALVPNSKHQGRRASRQARGYFLSSGLDTSNRICFRISICRSSSVFPAGN
jgi:hypothetical protein